jgi:hypothetical protein
LEIDNNITHSVPEMTKHITDYYQDILGVPGNKYATLGSDFCPLYGTG